MARSKALFAALLASAEALRLPPMTHSIATRRAALSYSAAALTGLLPPLTAVAADKGYLTLSEYQAIKQQEKKDEALYGLFEALRTRASQTGEFDKLASGDDIMKVSKLALAWESDIRKDVLDKASKSLTGADQAAGNALSKKVLEDLKQLDTLAKAGNKDGVPDASKSLRGHVLEFVELEPQKLKDKFGVDDL